MPYDEAGWWGFPIVFPILFPIIFPMAFMAFMMLRHGGPGGMMMMGHSHGRHGEPESSLRAVDRQRQPDQGSGSERPESPLEVAQRRYAAGEISREEFQRIRHDLEAP